MPALALALTIPSAALGQTDERSDRAYCLALADVYLRYIGFDGSSSSRSLVGRGSLDAQVAVEKCRQGRDTAWATKTLEQQLRSGGFALPQRR